MLNFYSVYFLVVISAVAQWGFMRVLMYRGLELEFRKFRQVRSMDYFFNRFSKPYLMLMGYTLFHVLFIAYSAIYLLKGLGMLSWESIIFTVVTCFFFIKDRVYYVTATYALSKSGDK